MINIVNLPATPKDFFACPKRAHRMGMEFLEESLEEDMDYKTTQLLCVHNGFRRSLSSPDLFEPKKLPSIKYLPDGRRSSNGKVEDLKPENLWEQLFTRSITRKIQDMTITPTNLPELTIKYSNFADDIAPSTRSPNDEVREMNNSNRQSNISQSLIQMSDFHLMMQRKPNANKGFKIISHTTA